MGGGPPIELTNFEERFLQILGEDMGLDSSGAMMDPYPKEVNL